MPDIQAANLEADPRFPSGAWTGFFLQYWLPGRHSTNVEMTFANGVMTGNGRDWVGAYTMNGTYDTATGKCEWKKQYRGKHSVMYRGVNDGRGIWGVWEIRQLGGLFVDRGGFHLWPEGSDVSAESAQTEQAVVEVMRREFGSRPSRAGAGLLLMVPIIILAILLWWKFSY